MNSLRGAGRRITVRFLTAAFVFLYIYEVITQGNKAGQSFIAAQARSAERNGDQLQVFSAIYMMKGGTDSPSMRTFLQK